MAGLSEDQLEDRYKLNNKVGIKTCERAGLLQLRFCFVKFVYTQMNTLNILLIDVASCLDWEILSTIA